MNSPAQHGGYGETDTHQKTRHDALPSDGGVRAQEGGVSQDGFGEGYGEEMKRWLYIHWIALRHFASATSMGMYWEERWHPWELLKLRWIGGLRWGEHWWMLLREGKRFIGPTPPDSTGDWEWRCARCGENFAWTGNADWFKCEWQCGVTEETCRDNPLPGRERRQRGEIEWVLMPSEREAKG